MLVYRVCSKEEVDFILANGDMSLVGNIKQSFNKNTFHYAEHEKYMHFFPIEGNVFLVGQFPKDYICVYDIPENLLIRGFGYYRYVARKFILEEFAVQSKYMKAEYLKRVKMPLGWLNEGFIMSEIPEDLTEIIYDCEEPIFGGR